MPATDTASRLTPYIEERLLGIGALGAGLALAANEDLRSSLFGSSSQPGQPSEGS